MGQCSRGRNTGDAVSALPNLRLCRGIVKSFLNTFQQKYLSLCALSWSYSTENLVSLQVLCISGGCLQAPLAAATSELRMWLKGAISRASLRPMKGTE